MSSIPNIFEPAINCPDPELKDRFDRLVGLDHQKDRLVKMLSLLINPIGIKSWAKKFHPDATTVIDYVLSRPPLVVLEGDVGSGKTELATTVGDVVARREKVDITLLPFSLSARGKGLVGEMTHLINTAFDRIIEDTVKYKSESGIARHAMILLVDEADALAQSRVNAQMHHEDKAGVNAFIRGIDRLGNAKVPAAVIMCTNRVNSLDPAIKRRAAEILKFTRPNDKQRLAVLETPLKELGFNEKEIQLLVKATGQQNRHQYGYTYSDLTQRLLPSIILDAYPNQPANAEKAMTIIQTIQPTPPFVESE